jgi:AraC-like DNA-binding protein
MAVKPRQLHDDEWRDALARNFNGLVPALAARDDVPARGWLAGAQLGEVAAFHVAGTSQVLARSPARARKQPSDLLKVCIQRAGTATISQDGREVLLAPGAMAIYDIDRPYTIALDGDWRCSVIAFPRSAFVASKHFIDAVICRSTSVAQGPGSVLAPLVASAVNGDAAGGSTSDVLMGHASLDLLRAALAAVRLPERPDAVVLAIDAYIRRHLADAGLSHAAVAAAHHMSERTLHRLFEASGQSVTDLIRAYRLDGIMADLRSASSASDTINQVAARWGMHDMPHLTRAFRARFAMTPTQARQLGPAGR